MQISETCQSLNYLLLPKQADLIKVAQNVEKMKTQVILIAAVAVLLGTEAILLKPAPGTSVAHKRPGMNSRKVLRNIGNYISDMNNGHTGSILGEFNSLQFSLNPNNVLTFNPTSIHLVILPFYNGSYVEYVKVV